MRTRRYVAIGLGLVLAAAACGAGYYYWKQAQERAARAQRRAQELDKALAALRSGAGENAEFRQQLAKLEEAGKRELPDWGILRDELTKCADFDERMRKAAAEKRIQQMAEIAIQGMNTSMGLSSRAIESSRTVMRQTEGLIEAEKYGQFDQVLRRAQVNLAVSQGALIFAQAFAQVAGVAAINAPPADRDAVFQMMAKEHPSASLEPVRARLANTMREAYVEEDDAGIKTRMRETLGRLKIPLTVETPKSTKQSGTR